MNTPVRNPKGFSLLELVIGMFIFAVGMLALASLQGQLTRSQVDAAVRSVATNIAEEQIELIRGFGLIEDNPANSIPAYEEIQTGSFTVSRGNVDYVVTRQVTDYYYDPVSGQFGTSNPEQLKVSDFKDVTVNVSWGATPGFRTGAGNQVSAADMGTGRIQLAAIISSVTTQGAARSSTQGDTQDLLPAVDFTPGENPDIISLQLGPTRFKESTQPLPRVYRSEERVETRFDVITYSQVAEDAMFLRREEFIAVSCDCEMRAPGVTAEQSGRQPTIWAADEYAVGDYAIKASGIPASNQQSIFCDECCRDHHDGPAALGDAAAALYDPFRSAGEYWTSGTFQGDHKHFGRNQRGELVLAQAAGDTYVESCKMVRVDGFMRVGQDLRQEGRNVLPENFLDDDAEVSTYSNWVTTGVDQFENALFGDYESSPPSLAAAPVEPAVGGFPASTSIPTTLGASTQQLRSRGIYIDYMSDDLRAAIDCLRILPDSGEASDCDNDTVQFDKNASKNPLEYLPFFDVQLTWLNRWSESPLNQPIDTTNEPVLTDNAHSRGVASNTIGSGDAIVSATGHMGNLGLTDTDPIDPGFAGELRSANLVVSALNELPPPPPGSIIIRGLISSGVTGLKATDIRVEGDQASCNRLPDGYICEFSDAAEGVTLKVFDYKKQTLSLAACSPTLTKLFGGVDADGRGFAFFDLSPALDGAASHDISIQEGACEDAL